MDYSVLSHEPSAGWCFFHMTEKKQCRLQSVKMDSMYKECICDPNQGKRKKQKDSQLTAVWFHQKTHTRIPSIN